MAISTAARLGLGPTDSGRCARLAISGVVAAGLALLISLLAADHSRASGCTITWVGDVNGSWFGGVAGADTNWSDDTFPDAGDHVCLGAGASPYGVALGTATTVDHYTVDAGATLAINGVVLRAQEDSANAGAIEMSGAAAGLATEDGDPTSAETLVNSGSIRLAGGGLLFGDVANSGSLTVARPAALRQGFEPRPPTLVNSGTLTVEGTGSLGVDDGVLEQAPGGTIGGPGPVNLFGDTGLLRVTGGSIAASADVNLGANNSDLAFVSAAGASGRVDVAATTGEHLLRGDVPAGFAIDVESNVALRASSSYVNAGTINLDTPTSVLATENGNTSSAETMTNTGLISLAGGILSGDVVNAGRLSVGGSSTFRSRFEPRAPVLSNVAGGEIEVATTANLAAATAQPIANAGVVRVRGSLASNGYSQSGGATDLDGASASLTVPFGLPLTLEGGDLSGEGTVSGGVVNAAGTVRPGSSPGVLAVTGDYSQGEAATLAIEIAAPEPGTGHDQLRVGGQASLGGTLAVETAGYSPGPGQSLTVLEAAGVSGTFAGVQEAGADLDVVYDPTAVRLITRPMEPPPPPDCESTGGAGSLATPSKAHFAFATRLRDGMQGGAFVYVDPRSRLVMAGTRIDDVTFADQAATIEGRAWTVRGPVSFAAKVTDAGSGPGGDSFAIELSSGYSAAGGLARGDIRLDC